MKRWIYRTAIAGPILFWLSVLISGWLTPGYSHFNSFISELAAKGAKLSFVMNFAGIIPFGLSIAVSSIIFWNRMKTGIAGKIGWFLLILSGLLFVLAGLFQCDEGCTFIYMSQEAIIHNLSAMFAFLLGMLTILLFGINQLVRDRKDMIGLWSLVLGFCCLVFFYLLSISLESPIRGVFQRGFLLSFSIWLVWLLSRSRITSNPD